MSVSIPLIIVIVLVYLIIAGIVFRVAVAVLPNILPYQFIVVTTQIAGILGLFWIVLVLPALAFILYLSMKHRGESSDEQY